jgi:hypothetical protein
LAAELNCGYAASQTPPQARQLQSDHLEALDRQTVSLKRFA